MCHTTVLGNTQKTSAGISGECIQSPMAFFLDPLLSPKYPVKAFPFFPPEFVFQFSIMTESTATLIECLVSVHERTLMFYELIQLWLESLPDDGGAEASTRARRGSSGRSAAQESAPERNAYSAGGRRAARAVDSAAVVDSPAVATHTDEFPFVSEWVGPLPWSDQELELASAFGQAAAAEEGHLRASSPGDDSAAAAEVLAKRLARLQLLAALQHERRQAAFQQSLSQLLPHPDELAPSSVGGHAPLPDPFKICDSVDAILGRLFVFLRQKWMATKTTTTADVCSTGTKHRRPTPPQLPTSEPPRTMTSVRDVAQRIGALLSMGVMAEDGVASIGGPRRRSSASTRTSGGQIAAAVKRLFLPSAAADSVLRALQWVEPAASTRGVLPAVSRPPPSQGRPPGPSHATADPPRVPTDPMGVRRASADRSSRVTAKATTAATSSSESAISPSSAAPPRSSSTAASEAPPGGGGPPPATVSPWASDSDAPANSGTPAVAAAAPSNSLQSQTAGLAFSFPKRLSAGTSRVGSASSKGVGEIASTAAKLPPPPDVAQSPADPRGNEDHHRRGATPQKSAPSSAPMGPSAAEPPSQQLLQGLRQLDAAALQIAAKNRVPSHVSHLLAVGATGGATKGHDDGRGVAPPSPVLSGDGHRRVDGPSSGTSPQPSSGEAPVSRGETGPLLDGDTLRPSALKSNATVRNRGGGVAHAATRAAPSDPDIEAGTNRQAPLTASGANGEVPVEHRRVVGRAECGGSIDPIVSDDEDASSSSSSSTTAADSAGLQAEAPPAPPVTGSPIPLSVTRHQRLDDAMKLADAAMAQAMLRDRWLPNGDDGRAEALRRVDEEADRPSLRTRQLERNLARIIGEQATGQRSATSHQRHRPAVAPFRLQEALIASAAARDAQGGTIAAAVAPAAAEGSQQEGTRSLRATTPAMVAGSKKAAAPAVEPTAMIALCRVVTPDPTGVVSRPPPAVGAAAESDASFLPVVGAVVGYFPIPHLSAAARNQRTTNRYWQSAAAGGSSSSSAGGRGHDVPQHHQKAGGEPFPPPLLSDVMREKLVDRGPASLVSRSRQHWFLEP